MSRRKNPKLKKANAAGRSRLRVQLAAEVWVLLCNAAERTMTASVEWRLGDAPAWVGGTDTDYEVQGAQAHRETGDE